MNVILPIFNCHKSHALVLPQSRHVTHHSHTEDFRRRVRSVAADVISGHMLDPPQRLETRRLLHEWLERGIINV